MANIAILISGHGSNLQAFIDAELHDINIVVVVSNQASAYGLQRAIKANIPIACINTEDELINVLTEYSLDLIVLAGYMRILSSTFVNLYEGKILNIHPSLLPKYPGLHTHQRVLNAGDKIHGCTVHYVTEELDSGPILAQDILTVTHIDTEETLKARIQKLEHKLYPSVVNNLF